MATRQPAEAADKAAPAEQGARIKWDDSAMKSSYANVGQQEVTIQLTDRIIIRPYAAKRLVTLLDGVVQEYEKRFGTLHVEGPQARS